MNPDLVKHILQAGILGAKAASEALTTYGLVKESLSTDDRATLDALHDQLKSQADAIATVLANTADDPEG